MADYAIHDTTLIGTSNVIRKKEGSSALIDPADYPKRINLMGMLEVKTQASAPVCAFSDGADDVPSSSVKVDIPANLDGVSSVSETQAGRNLLDITDIYGEGYYNTSGTWSASSSYNCYSLSCKPNTTYTVSGNFAGILTYWKADGTFISGVNQGSGFSKTFTTPEDCYIFRRSILKTNIDGTQMVEVGSTAHAYEPYTTPTTYTASLGRTIYGGTADIVNGEGQETHAKMTFTGADAENWQFSASGSSYRVFAQLTNAKTDTNTFASNLITPAPSASGYPAIGQGWINNNGRIVIGVDSTITSASDWKTYLSNNNMEIAYELADEYKTDFTFDGQEVSTRLGDNAFWSDEGDTEVTYRSSGTITPVVPTLITKTITDNGTYDAEDDDADGYSSVTVNVSGVPSGDHDDPLGIMTDYTRFNVQNLYSAYYIGGGELKKEVVFQMASATGYEGFCISLDGLNLTNGTQYTLSFVLNVPTGVTFSGSYAWGIKYSATRVPSSGSASTSTFNLTPDVNFLEQTGAQNVSMTFTAGQTNYLLVLLARIAGSNTSWITMRDVKIEEVSP